MPEHSYQEIESYSKLARFQENLEGYFLSSVLSNQPELYSKSVYKIILLGAAYRMNPAAVDGMEMRLENSTILERDVRKIVAHTNICLHTVIRGQSIDKTKEVIRECIRLLFDVGYRYDGTDLSGETSTESVETKWKPSNVAISYGPEKTTDENNVPDFKADDDMDDILRNLLGDGW